MSDALEEARLDQALRDGLRALPIPETSPGFDARVLTALCAPTPWRRWWEPARPLLLGASCSLAATLLALHWSMSVPVTTPRPPILRESERSLAAAPTHMPSLDALLDHPNLSAGSLAVWEGPPTPTTVDGGGAGKNDPAEGRLEPHRRAQLLRCPILIV